MRRALILPFILVLLLAACGGGGDGEEATDSAETDAEEASEHTHSASSPEDAPDDAQGAAKAFDPPKGFSASGVKVPDELQPSADNAVLAGEQLFVATADALTAIDATPAEDDRTAEELWSSAIEGAPPQSGARAGAPVLTSDGKTVLAAFAITVPGRGTTAAHQAVEVLAVDAESGDTEWTTQIDIPTTVAGDSVSEPRAWVVGATDTAIVIGYEAGVPFTVVLDPAGQAAKWSSDTLAPISVHGDVVVGGVGTLSGLDRGVQQVKGVNIADGTDKWVIAATEDKEWDRFVPDDASPNLIALDRAGSDPANGYTPFADLTFVDPASGSVVATVPVHPNWEAVDCGYDAESISVCEWTTPLGDLSVAAYDGQSGAALWELTKGVSTRLAPQVTALFHGNLYGTTDNGPVVLDIRTGADLSDTPGIAPRLVSEYAGVVDGAIHLAIG